ncbi:MAG: hypothetical protein ACFFD6_09540, partial [Candidatus Thorarchaeota archaeon]
MLLFVFLVSMLAGPILYLPSMASGLSKSQAPESPIEYETIGNILVHGNNFDGNWDTDGDYKVLQNKHITQTVPGSALIAMDGTTTPFRIEHCTLDGVDQKTESILLIDIDTTSTAFIQYNTMTNSRHGMIVYQ